MAKKKFLVNIDLNLNQLINSRAENGTGFTTGGINSKGRLMYDTSTNRVLYDTGVAIETIANLNDVTGLLDFHGGYNALTNTPNLVNPPSGTIFKGDFYIVTVAGTFYGVALEIGDSLFASVDNPTTLNGWVIVQGNVAYATETIAGIILLATQTEVNTGTNNSKAVTPLTLSTYVANTLQNIYNTDGTLTANRTVTLDNKSLVFNGSGTSFIDYNINNGVQNAIQTFNANLVSHYIYNETLQLFSKANIENGIVSLKVFNVPLTINRSLVVNQFGTRINSIYYLPNVDGTAGQVMTTDGSGNLSWGAVSNNNIYNTNGVTTGNRVVTFNTNNLSFEGAGGTFRVLNDDLNTQKQSSITNNLNSNVIQVIEEFGVNAQIQVFSPQILQTVINIDNDTFTTQTAFLWGVGIKNFGTSVFSIGADAFGFNINNQYTFPKFDGTAGQVLTTNGAGTVTWATGGSGSSVNIYNTDGTLTGNRVVTLSTNNLNFNGTGGTTVIKQTNTSSGNYSSITNNELYNLIRISNSSLTIYSNINQSQTNLNATVQNTNDACVVNQGANSIITTIYDTNVTNVAFRLDVLTTGLKINNAYTLPKVDGTAGQFLQTNGAGVLGWNTGTNINIYNLDGSLSSNRTVTINDRTLLFEGNQFSTYRVDLRDVTTERYSITDNGLTRILNEVGNNSFTLYNKVDITSGAVTTTSTSGAQSSTITSIPTTIVNTVSAVAQSCSTALTLNGFRINNVYTLPKVDGTAGQVLTTNGSGAVTWATGGSGSSVNIYNTDGTLTGDRQLDGNDIYHLWLFNLRNIATQLKPDSGDVGAFEVNVVPANLLSTSRLFRVYDITEFAERLAVTKLGAVIFNNAYTFPLTDGTAGQVLTTNGSGAVTWATGGDLTDIWKLNPNETYRGFSFNNNATTVIADGGAVASTSASTLAVTVSGSSFVNKQVRLRFYASVVSAGRYTGTRGSALLWFIGGGFRYVCDFNISDTAYVSQPQQFYGLASTTNDLAYAGVSGVQINTLFNIIGVGNDTADTNLQIFHNDATGTATKIDLGSGFPANRTSGAVSTTVYEIQILNLPASADVLYRVVNKETGAIATGTLTTNLPASTLGLNFFASRCMTTIGSVTGSGQFDLCRLGVYSML